MKRCFALLLLFSIAVIAAAQNGPQNQAYVPVISTQFTLPLLTNPDPAYSATIAQVGLPGPQVVYYWISANYLVGSASLAGPFTIYSANAVLSSQNYNTINPSLSPSALTYDVLKTSTANQPTGACDCAVATGVSPGTITNDETNSTSTYTVNPLNPSTLTLTLTNEAQSADVSDLILRQNGAFVANLSTGGGGGGSVASVFGRTGAVVAASGDYSVAQITGAAPLNSPTFTGNVTISGLANGCLDIASGIIGTTGSPCGSGGGAVSSVFGRTGVVTATSGDYTVSEVTGAAPLASPSFTGTVTIAGLNGCLNAVSGVLGSSGETCGNLTGTGTNNYVAVWNGSNALTFDVGFQLTPGVVGSGSSPNTLSVGNSTTGVTGVTGQIELCAYGAGQCTFIQPPASGSGGFLSLPANSVAGGTFAVSASSPLVLNATTGNLTCPSCGSGAVSSVANSDSTLTISPTTGSVVASLNLANPNTWTGLQTFGLHISIGGVTPSGVSGTTNLLFSNSPTLVTPNLGTPSTLVLTNATGLPLTGLAAQATNTITGNATSGSASPTALPIGSCSGASNALIWTTNTGFGCNTISTGLSGLNVNGVLYAPTSSSASSVTPPSTNGVYNLAYNVVGGVTVPPTAMQVGFNNVAVSGSTTTYTILYSSNAGSVEHDRNATGTLAVSLPTPTTLGNSAFVVSYCNYSAQTDTLTPVTWTINGNASISVPSKSCHRISVDPFNATNWISIGQGPGINCTTCTTNAVGFSVNGLVAATSAGGQATQTASQHNIAVTWGCADTSGSGTAQSCSTLASLVTPVTDDCVMYTTTTTNSGTGLTINVNSLGAKSIAIPGSSGWTTTLTALIIPANKPLYACYDGTNWNVQQTGTVASGGGAVSSVSNSDGTLTISPTTGAVVASLALSHANTWSGQQTFVAPVLGTPASANLANATGYPTIHTLSFQFGTPGGSAISTGILGYMTVPIGCTLTGWYIQVDAGTATVKTLKVAAGTAIPTLGSNSISTSGVAISTGTVIQSTTLTDFTTTTFTAKDIVAADLITTSGVGYIDFQLVLGCTQ